RTVLCPRSPAAFSCRTPRPTGSPPWSTCRWLAKPVTMTPRAFRGGPSACRARSCRPQRNDDDRGDVSVLAHLVKCVPPVVREGRHRAGPAAFFARLRPWRAEEEVRAVDLVYRAMAWAVMRDLLLGAADTHGEVLARHPRHGAHAGDLEKIGDVLGIVDLVEERLFVGVDIHVHHKAVLGADRHAELPRLSCACVPPAGGSCYRR